jgi:hypothetical protein
VIAPILACAACFGANVQSPLTDGARIGVWLLLGVTLCVQGGFAAFFIHLRRHAKRAQAAQLAAEWSELQQNQPGEA